MAGQTTPGFPRKSVMTQASRTPTATATVATNRPTAAASKPTREQIAARAQEIYLRRCRTRESGDAVSDWLKAESELTAANRR